MLTKFQIKDKFWGGYQKLVCDTVIPYQYRALNDEIEGVEKSHAIENFRIAAGKSTGDFYGFIFQDSDLAKWIEAAAYALTLKQDKALEAKVDDAIALIAQAQGEDGYLNTYFTLAHPERRWENLQEAHELYCAGHMMEAAVAYHRATGKDSLLKVMCKNADHIDSVFGNGKRRGFPGHPEVELALMKLYHATGERRYLNLAKYFVDERGTQPDFFGQEKEKRTWSVWGTDPADQAYAQNSAPVRQQAVAQGHAVRAAYLYTGMADVAMETEDETLKSACKRLWKNMTQKQMYITGGIGATVLGEAFTKDYDLPNDTAYAESCASIALIFFAKRLLAMEKEGSYGDEMERALYNGVLSGMSQDGTRFFYVNPLEVNPTYSGAIATHKHVLPQRPGWYGCACCPPNIARLIASLSDYAWLEQGNTLYSNLFIGGVLTTEKFCVQVETTYPFGGEICYTVTKAEKHGVLALRIPGWSQTFTVKQNGKPVDITPKKGFAYVENVQAGDTICLHLDMQPRRVYSHLAVRENLGACALQRGPLVYCLESADNGDLYSLRIQSTGAILEQATNQLGGIVSLQVPGYRLHHSAQHTGLYSFQKPTAQPVTIQAVPYYAWGNRGLGSMAVWVKEME